MLEDKVSVFAPSLVGGGAERVLVTLANAFAMRGYNVDLVLATAVGPYLEDVSSSVRMIDLRAGRIMRAIIPLARYLRREQPDAMLSALGHANVAAIIAKIISRSSTRLVVSEHTTVSPGGGGGQTFIARVNWLLMRLLYPGADGICTVSKAASKGLARSINMRLEDVQTIYNPFDLALIARQAAQPLDDAWLGENDVPVLLAAGRLNDEKDYPTLIRAFSQLRERRKARLLILGEGPLRAELERLAQNYGLTDDDLRMPGFARNPYAYMARCSVFVLSSRREGLPTVLIEAMTCGAPVVSTNCPSGPDEILEGGRWGQLVPVGDVAGLARALEFVLDVPTEQLPDVRMRAEDFEQEKAVDAYLQILGL